MNANVLPHELEQPEIQEAIIGAITKAYDENVSRHDPEVGDDAMTFGIHLWKSATFFMAEILAGLPGARTELVQQSLAIQIGSCHLRVHKLGDSEFDDPMTSFPAHAGPAARMYANAKQLELAIQFETAPEFVDWVVGHYGSPDEGLRAVRFQAVGDQRSLDGSISSWEAVATIFDVAIGSAVSLPAAGPAPQSLPEPRIALRDRKEANQTDNA